jgi:hypothetical protein
VLQHGDDSKASGRAGKEQLLVASCQLPANAMPLPFWQLTTNNCQLYIRSTFNVRRRAIAWSAASWGFGGSK